MLPTVGCETAECILSLSFLAEIRVGAATMIGVTCFGDQHLDCVGNQLLLREKNAALAQVILILFELKAFLNLITVLLALDCFLHLFALLFAHLGRSIAV